MLLGFMSSWYLHFPGAASNEEVTEENEGGVVAHPLITVSNISEGDVVLSPLQLEGQARGYWFFEGSFPVVVTNWDGLIIAEGIATAEGEWMTEEFVPFKSVLTFISPYKTGDPEFMKRGSLILKRDNPSGLPENNDAYELTVYFGE